MTTKRSNTKDSPESEENEESYEVEAILSKKIKSNYWIT